MYDLSVALIGMSAGPEGQLWSRATLDSAWQRVPNSALPGGDYRSIAVKEDGSILGMDLHGSLFTRDTLTSPWRPISNGALPGGDKGSIAVMQDGCILGVGFNGNLYTCAKLTDRWVEVPNSSGLGSVGSADGGSSVTIMPDGRILGMATNNNLVQLYIREKLDAQWEPVPNSSLNITRSAWERFRITILKDGTILCLGFHNNYLWRRSTLDSGWQEVCKGDASYKFMGIVGVASGERVAIAQLSSQGTMLSTGLELQIKLSKRVEELERLKLLEAKEKFLNELIGRVLKNKDTSQSADMKELEEYIGKSQEREEILKKGSEINQLWQDTKIAVSTAKASADEAELNSQEAFRLYSDTPEANSASAAAKEARQYADQAEKSLTQIKKGITDQGFTIDDLDEKFTTLLLKKDKIAQNPDPGNSGTGNAVPQSNNNAVETQVASALKLNNTAATVPPSAATVPPSAATVPPSAGNVAPSAGNVAPQPKTTIEKLEEIKRIAQKAKDQAENHRDCVVEKKGEVKKYLEDAKKVYKNWDSVRILFGLDSSQSSKAPTAISSSPASQTSAEASNWASVKGLFSIKDSPSTNNSSSNQ